MSVRNRGSLKNPLVLLALVAVLGGGGFLAYSHYSQGSKIEEAQARLDKANAWRQELSRKLSPDRRFGRVQLGVRPDESDKADHYIEIAGAVQTQADLDAFEAMLKTPQFTPPIRVEKTIKVEFLPDPGADAPPAGKPADQPADKPADKPSPTGG